MTEAELLFSKVFNCSRISLYLDRDIKINKKISSFLASVLKRRIQGLPLPYILGKIEFMGLVFEVNEEVFIPRPETEILVETVLKLVSSVPCLPSGRKYRVSSVNILDIGTGSGCIAISLAKFLSNVKITATDISLEALKIAKQNAILNNVKINFLLIDLFNNYELRTNNYELIISNPPYVPTTEIKRLQPEVRCEPRIALDAGRDGLDFYRRIITQSPLYLEKCGFLIMEMGFNQANAIKDILKNSHSFQIIEVVKDYNGIDRVIVARKNG